MKMFNIFSRKKSKNSASNYDTTNLEPFPTCVLRRSDKLKSITIDMGSCIQTYTAKNRPIEVLSDSHEIVELRLDETRFTAVLRSSIIDFTYYEQEQE
jgi:hypothetical protein